MARESRRKGIGSSGGQCCISVPLVEDLRDAGLSAVGTLRVNRALQPKELTVTSGRQANSSKFAYRNGVQLVCVILLTPRQERPSRIDHAQAVAGGPAFPEAGISAVLQQHEGGADVIDAMIGNAGASSGVVCRWSTRVLAFMATVSPPG